MEDDDYIDLDVDEALELLQKAKFDDKADEVPNMAKQVLPHGDSVFAVAVAWDADLIATGGGDDVACVWRLSDGSLVKKLKGHGDSVTCIAFNGSETLLATGALDGVIKV